MKCKMLFFKILITLVIVLLSGVVSAQGYKGYPEMCQENAAVINPGASEYMTCLQKRAGTTLATPSWFRLVDWDSTLALDLVRLNAILAGIGANQIGVVGASTSWGYDLALARYYPTTSDLPNDAVPSGTTRGLASMALNMFYNTAAVGNPWARWHGGDYSSDNDAAATIMPYTKSYLMGWYAGGTRAARLRLDNAFRLIVSVQDPLGGGAGAAGIRVAPPDDLQFRVSSDNNQNAVANPLHMELSDGAAPFLDNTASPGYVRNQDGDSTVLQDVVTSTAAGMSKSLNGAKTESVMYGDNGAALDPVTLNATGAVNVEDVVSKPGDNAGLGAKETKISYLGITEPAMQGPTAVDDTAISATTGIVIFDPVKVLPNGRLCVYVQNTGGGSGDAFSDVEILDSPDGTTGWVATNTWETCDSLVSGAALCKYCSDDAMPWIQVKARCAATDDTEAKAWLAQVKR